MTKIIAMQVLGEIALLKNVIHVSNLMRSVQESTQYDHNSRDYHSLFRAPV